MIDGYPSEQELRRIVHWSAQEDFLTLLEFVGTKWTYAQGGWKRRGRWFSISTGGWSGNEDLLAALMKNHVFWSCCWVSSRRGGHYRFHVPVLAPFLQHSTVAHDPTPATSPAAPLPPRA